ncbi:hypothetical protein AXX17_AT4G27700 [Arabidopsis thaliana]|jgi:hypothetical protein|uniref:Secreted protein n=1 Tax=Arabidopsis thaliana TaxID=3702 RepID=A0A178UTV1_ARATH|nr:hypothetical protein AXX17_AT4G27700 [Arabidopsis thaliana]
MPVPSVRLFSVPQHFFFVFLCRLIAPPVQNISVQARVNAKRHEVDQKVEHRGGKRKTLDSRFASMKEQRMTINNYGVTVQVPRLPPWVRARRFSQ